LIVVSVEDFAFTIGYDGAAAVVDKAAQSDNAGADPVELCEKGLFRAAFAMALRMRDEATMKSFIDAFNKKASIQIRTPEEFSRLFGVYDQEIAKVKKM
jgi:hypothetical protein